MFNDKNRKVITPMQNNPETELVPNDLEKQLDAELAKPAEQVDLQRVEELLEAMGTEPAPEGTREQVWQNIQARLRAQEEARKRKAAYWKSAIGRVAAIACVMLAVYGATIGMAKAFRWTFIMKWIEPASDTFSIHVNDDPATQSAQGNSNVHSLGERQTDMVQYADLNEVPKTVEGYKVIPGELPERYKFVCGSRYFDGIVTSVTLYYEAESTEWLNLNIQIFADDGDVGYYEYETVLDTPLEKLIGNKDVTFYHNAEDELQSASWVDGDANYLLNGEITEEELIRIIVSFET